jgi:hypothetical protein
MADYGHAAELQRTQPPLSRLEYLVRQLGLYKHRARRKS